jgi:hypothetical protein
VAADDSAQAIDLQRAAGAALDALGDPPRHPERGHLPLLKPAQAAAALLAAARAAFQLTPDQHAGELRALERSLAPHDRYLGCAHELLAPPGAGAPLQVPMPSWCAWLVQRGLLRWLRDPDLDPTRTQLVQRFMLAVRRGRQREAFAFDFAATLSRTARPELYLALSPGHASNDWQGPVCLRLGTSPQRRFHLGPPPRPGAWLDAGAAGAGTQTWVISQDARRSAAEVGPAGDGKSWPSGWPQWLVVRLTDGDSTQPPPTALFWLPALWHRRQGEKAQAGGREPQLDQGARLSLGIDIGSRTTGVAARAENGRDVLGQVDLPSGLPLPSGFTLLLGDPAQAHRFGCGEELELRDGYLPTALQVSSPAALRGLLRAPKEDDAVFQAWLPQQPRAARADTQPPALSTRADTQPPALSSRADTQPPALSTRPDTQPPALSTHSEPQPPALSSRPEPQPPPRLELFKSPELLHHSDAMAELLAATDPAVPRPDAPARASLALMHAYGRLLGHAIAALHASPAADPHAPDRLSWPQLGSISVAMTYPRLRWSGGAPGDPATYAELYQSVGERLCGALRFAWPQVSGPRLVADVDAAKATSREVAPAHECVKVTADLGGLTLQVTCEIFAQPGRQALQLPGTSMTYVLGGERWLEAAAFALAGRAPDVRSAYVAGLRELRRLIAGGAALDDARAAPLGEELLETVGLLIARQVQGTLKRGAPHGGGLGGASARVLLLGDGWKLFALGRPSEAREAAVREELLARAAVWLRAADVTDVQFERRSKRDLCQGAIAAAAPSAPSAPPLPSLHLMGMKNGALDTQGASWFSIPDPERAGEAQLETDDPWWREELRGPERPAALCAAEQWLAAQGHSRFENGLRGTESSYDLAQPALEQFLRTSGPSLVALRLYRRLRFDTKVK